MEIFSSTETMVHLSPTLVNSSLDLCDFTKSTQKQELAQNPLFYWKKIQVK